MHPSELRAEAPYRPKHRPGAAALVLALHLLLGAGLWQAMRTRVVEVTPPQPSLTWVRPVPAPARRPMPPEPAARAEPTARTTLRPAAPPPAEAPRAAPTASPELTWVEPAAPAVATAPASAASAPSERLLDTAATRAALRRTGQQPLLHERAAEATGTTIARTDTALAQDVAEAGTPDCLRDGKAASGQIGPVGLGGLLGLPFLAARVATGKCAK